MPKNSLQVRGGRAEKGAAEIDARRRSALAKLGIAAGIAYAVPIILRLDRAHAKPCTTKHDHGGCEVPGH